MPHSLHSDTPNALGVFDDTRRVFLAFVALAFWTGVGNKCIHGDLSPHSRLISLL